MKALIGAMLLLLVIYAQAAEKPVEQPESPLLHKKINEHFHLLLGGYGANIGILIASDGILLIDTLQPGHNQYLLSEIRKISDKPIKYVLNTHSDQDHNGGNAFFAKLGATIIFQENALYVYNNNTDYAYQAFKDKFSLAFGGETIFGYRESVHTLNDAIFHLPKSNYIFTGDIYNNNWPPMFSVGGIEGMERAISFMQGLANDNTIVVPGHGDIGNQQLLQDFRYLNSIWVARLEKMIEEGREVEYMLKDKKLKSILAQYLKDEKRFKISPEVYSRFVTRHVKKLSARANPVYVLPKDKFSLYINHYRLDDGSAVEIFEEHDKLYVRKKSEFLVQLEPRSENRLYLKDWTAGEHFIFVFDKYGEAVDVALVMENKTYKVDKI